MKNRKKDEKTAIAKEKRKYKNGIVKMVKQIDENRFLKAIYISMSDYLKENEPD